MDGENVGVTSCKTAAEFHYRYNDEYTITKCYNCNNLFYIGKYPRQKNLWLRLRKFLVQFADGQRLIPFITLLTRNKYLIEGFVIIPIEGGEDRIECRECGEWTTLDNVHNSPNISLGPLSVYEDELNEFKQKQKERNKKLREQFEESREEDTITLPDGSNLKRGYVLIRIKVFDEPQDIIDILNITMGSRRLVANTLKFSDQEQLHDLLHLKEPRDSKLLQNYAITEKKAFEDSLYQRYPPQDHHFEIYQTIYPVLYHQFAEKMKRKGRKIWSRIRT